MIIRAVKEEKGKTILLEAVFHKPEIEGGFRGIGEVDIIGDEKAFVMVNCLGALRAVVHMVGCQ